jgi:hypothetical protein
LFVRHVNNISNTDFFLSITHGEFLVSSEHCTQPGYLINPYSGKRNTNIVLPQLLRAFSKNSSTRQFFLYLAQSLRLFIHLDGLPTHQRHVESKRAQCYNDVCKLLLAAVLFHFHLQRFNFAPNFRNSSTTFMFGDRRTCTHARMDEMP